MSQLDTPVRFALPELPRGWHYLIREGPLVAVSAIAIVFFKSTYIRVFFAFLLGLELLPLFIRHNWIQFETSGLRMGGVVNGFIPYSSIRKTTAYETSEPTLNKLLRSIHVSTEMILPNVRISWHGIRWFMGFMPLPVMLPSRSILIKLDPAAVPAFLREMDARSSP